MYPKYTRIANDIGIVYGNKLKNYQQAINWYKRCLQYSPKYFSSYNNVGVNYELMQNYTEAKKWYFKACEIKFDYRAPHTNLTDVFDTLKASDSDIINESEAYNLRKDHFYYQIGLSYYDKKQVDKSITWYQRALPLMGEDKYKVYNSLGIAYDEKGNFDEAIQNYLQCLQLKPDFHSAPYNIAIAYKSQNNIDEAIQWYIKALQINPKYSMAYLNLGNICKDRKQYAEAIEVYKAAISYNSTYTLAYVNIAVCYLKLQNYQQVFKNFSRAKELLPTDNNNLSESNKVFIKEQLDKFNAQALSYKVGSVVNPQWLQSMDALVKQFDQQFGGNPAAFQQLNRALQASNISGQYIVDALARMKGP